MTRSAQLIARVREHYESRCFSPRLVDSLCGEIERRSHPDGLEIAQGWRVPMQTLCETFRPVEQSHRPAMLHPAPAAILAFSFGHRLDAPFARRPTERRPGPNNEAIAAMTRRCHAIFPEAWIAVQHEVGLALSEADGDPLVPPLVGPARDWSTQQVVDHFVDHLPAYAFAPGRCLIVVSHLHHYGRIELLLARAGLDAYPAPKEVAAYADYDPQEAEPRFRSPWEHLVNDFLAICKTARIRSGRRSPIVLSAPPAYPVSTCAPVGPTRVARRQPRAARSAARSPK
jgi:hypothetical protein